MWNEIDMDAEDLAKAAIKAIDDWLDEEIVGFEPKCRVNVLLPPLRYWVASHAICSGSRRRCFFWFGKTIFLIFPSAENS